MPFSRGREVISFRRKYKLTQRQLAKRLGISSPLISQIEAEKVRWRLLYAYALIGLERDLCRTAPKYRPPLQVPPKNREQILCPTPAGGRLMYRLCESKDSAGARIWRMMCAGSKRVPHARNYIWVDIFGRRVDAPPKSRRRRLAPFELRDGPATCEAPDCRRVLLFQEEKTFG